MAIVTTPNVSQLSETGQAGLSGAVTLSEGANVTLTQSGQDIAIAASSGLGTAAQGCKVFLSGDGTLSNGTVYKFLFNTEVYDTGGAWGTANAEYIVPASKGGFYFLGVFAYLYSAITVGNQYKSYIYVNGVEIHEDQFVGAFLNTGETTKCVTMHRLAAGATVTFHGFAPNANTLVYANGGTTTHTWAFVQQITQD